MTDILALAVPFGRDSQGVIRSAYEVERGKACGCTCMVCEKELVAKQGDKTAWHFAHLAEQEGNERCGEGAIHKAAKEALASSVGKVANFKSPYGIWQPIPPWLERDAEVYDKPRRMRIGKVVLEQSLAPLNNRRVDALVTPIIEAYFYFGRSRWEAIGKGQRFAVEIKVTHGKDEGYIREMEAAGISALEVEVKQQDIYAKLQQPNCPDVLSALKSLILVNTHNHRWLHWDARPLLTPSERKAGV